MLCCGVVVRRDGGDTAVDRVGLAAGPGAALSPVVPAPVTARSRCAAAVPTDPNAYAPAPTTMATADALNTIASERTRLFLIQFLPAAIHH
ncbi:hypothetical protein Pme01_45520 [Planosporangium mesophilum]|uniref:Uncharacterized protein n=1 Tax=Planosporangium mesophilum TaxID=689768 RepID=A0A8J3TD44_9ACTN|nr:hypothetical protein Pme01_45520 [Planosporangium mesophilum]